MENQRIIPKDHKDMLACLMKFKAALDDQKSKSDNSLPEFYKNVTLSYSISPLPPATLLSFIKVLKWALFVWTFFAVFFSQHTLHHTEWNLGLPRTLIYNFPGSTVTTLKN